jgi:hypothetical protein
MSVNRRDALLSIAVCGAVLALPACVVPESPSGLLSDGQMSAMLRLNGMDLGPGEGPKVLASFRANRFTASVDPMIQPNSDFDPAVD